jgi:hypothetical protein
MIPRSRCRISTAAPGKFPLGRTTVICPPYSLRPGIPRMPDWQSSFNSDLYPEVGSNAPSCLRDFD